MVTHLYDAATGRLTEVYAHTGATVIEEESYTYNVWGSRHTRADVLHDETETYSYDEDARVTGSSAQLANGNTVTTLSAHYDAADNLLSKSDAGGTLTYTYQGGHPNRLASLAVSGGNPGVAGGSVTYDPAGRITSGAGYTLSYDRRGRTATIARFLSPDPAGVGSPYVYVGDNAESDVDPTGELNWNSVGKIVEAAVIAAASFYTAGAVEAASGTA